MLYQRKRNTKRKKPGAQESEAEVLWWRGEEQLKQLLKTFSINPNVSTEERPLGPLWCNYTNEYCKSDELQLMPRVLHILKLVHSPGSSVCNEKGKGKQRTRSLATSATSSTSSTLQAEEWKWLVFFCVIKHLISVDTMDDIPFQLFDKNSDYGDWRAVASKVSLLYRGNVHSWKNLLDLNCEHSPAYMGLSEVKREMGGYHFKNVKPGDRECATSLYFSSFKNAFGRTTSCRLQRIRSRSKIDWRVHDWNDPFSYLFVVSSFVESACLGHSLQVEVMQYLFGVYQLDVCEQTDEQRTQSREKNHKKTED